MKSRLLSAAAAAAVLIALAGCGGSDSSGSKVADVTPPGVPVFVEGTLRPTGELKSNADAIASQVAGIDNLGDFVVEKLEEEADDEGEAFDYDKEVEPWLGERGAVFFEKLDEDDDLSGLGIVVESTD